MSESDTSVEDIGELPNPAAPRARAGASNHAQQEVEDIAMVVTAEERKTMQRAAVYARDKKMDPPPRDWEWKTEVLQADGATAVDLAFARIRSKALGATLPASAGGGGEGGEDVAASFATFHLQRREFIYWEGDDVMEMCKKLATCDVVAMDLEWRQVASAHRPRPGMHACSWALAESSASLEHLQLHGDSVAREQAAQQPRACMYCLSVRTYARFLRIRFLLAPCAHTCNRPSPHGLVVTTDLRGAAALFPLPLSHSVA